MTSLTLRRFASAHPHRIAPLVRPPHKETARRREARLRRRAGAAYTRLPGTLEELGAEIGRSHSALVHRRQGQGGLANVLLEVDAWERAGRDTRPLFEAMVATRIEARRARGEALPAPIALTVQETERDAAEDIAQARFHETGCARGWWTALVGYIAFAETTLLPALSAHEQGGAP